MFQMFSLFVDWTSSTLLSPILTQRQPPLARHALSVWLTFLPSAELPTIFRQSAEPTRTNTVKLNYIFVKRKCVNSRSFSVHRHVIGNYFGDVEHAFDWNVHFTFLANPHHPNSVRNVLHCSVRMSPVVHFRHRNADFIWLSIRQCHDNSCPEIGQSGLHHLHPHQSGTQHIKS